jgi:alkylated DNA repair dioxygenase AlkB
MPMMPKWQALPLAGADVALSPWLAAGEADELGRELLAQLPWETHRIRLFGRQVDVPRRSCWIGDAGTGYTYSGTRFEPHPWPSVLLPWRARVEQACHGRFNSVLANLYRDGNDSMGWHADDEPELGDEPLIASLSLGATRRFRFRRRRSPGGSHESLSIDLPHGSLLRMAGQTQALYQHALPKSRKVTGPRINLTFRWTHAPRR